MTTNDTFSLTLESAREFGKNSAFDALGGQVIALDDEQVVLHMPISNASRQPWGQLHGGVSLLLAETAASLHAAWGVDLNRVVPVGIEINGSHLTSAREGTVEAIGRVIRRGRNLVVHQVEITHLETGKMLCVARVTNFYKQLQGVDKA